MVPENHPLQLQTQPGNAPTTAAAAVYPTVDIVKKVCPDSDINNIRKYLPYVLKAMAQAGMTSKNDLIGILATIYVEVPVWAPIEEYGKGGGAHGIYYGRGFVQLTGSRKNKERQTLKHLLRKGFRRDRSNFQKSDYYG